MSFKPDSGLIDFIDNGRVTPFSFSTWEDMPATWESSNTWIIDPETTVSVNLPQIDLGSVQTVNIKTQVTARGLVSYTINYANQVPLSEDPKNYSTLIIEPGDVNIPSITARYIWICVDVTLVPEQGVQYFDNIEFSVITDSFKNISYSNINSATLPGTVSARQFTAQGAGSIRGAQITGYIAAEYDVDMYVYHSTASDRVFPNIIDKTSDTVTLSFTGVDGRPRDAVFDIDLQLLPEWYIDDQGNLQER